MNKIHVIHYQQTVEDHAFISSLLAADTMICVHHLSALSSLKTSLGYPVHCVLYECDLLTGDSLKETQICVDLKIPLLFLVSQLNADIHPSQLPGILLYKPKKNQFSSSFINQLHVNIRCLYSVPTSKNDDAPMYTNSHGLIAIGASAGGPKALRTILMKMPEWICGITIIQHMIDANTISFAKYLDQGCKLHVKVAEEGEVIKNGVVYIAKQKQHLVVKKSFGRLYLHYQDGDKVNCVCPSIDVLFQSLTLLHDPLISGVLLTGMGMDGAKGLKEMKDAGLLTIIQDKKTCELYGMPKEAKRIHAYQRELPLNQISDYLIYHYAALRQKKERSS